MNSFSKFPFVVEKATRVSDGGAAHGADIANPLGAGDVGPSVGEGPALRDADHVIAHIPQDTSKHIPKGEVGLVTGPTDAFWTVVGLKAERA